MIVGCNTDPAWFSDDLAAHARNLKAAGFSMARFPLVYSDSTNIYREFCLALNHEQIEPLPVFVRESTSGAGISEVSIRWWAELLPWATHWQIGNEADHKSPSSWTMDEGRFSALLRHARAAMPYAYLIAGAMVSGNPEYLDGCDLGPVDAIAIHGYGQRPDGYRGVTWGFGWLHDLYARYERFGKPIWGTEYGGTVDVGSGQFKTEGIFDDQADRANYYGRYIETFAQAGGAACFPFKFEDNGVPGYGIQGTPALTTVSEQIAKLATNIPIPIPGGTVNYTIDSETRTEINRLGWTPASDYVPEAGGGHVFCEEGIVYYLNGSGKFASVPFA